MSCGEQREQKTKEVYDHETVKPFLLVLVGSRISKGGKTLNFQARHGLILGAEEEFGAHY